MKINKTIILGAIASTMLFVSCNSNDNSDQYGDTSYEDSIRMVDQNRALNKTEEHPASDEHPASGSSEHPASGEHHALHNHDRKEVKLTVLPPAITEALKQDRFSDCKVQRAYVVKDENLDQKIYEVEVKRGEGKETFLFHENGDVIEK